MIPAAFEYVRAESVDHAVSALAEHGDEAKVLAGGQSLLPLMRLRLAAPEVVVDVGRLADLRGVREDGDALVIGALTTHHEVMNNELVRQHARLLAEVTATVADPAVRHRGTFGGSLAHADPAGDLPAAALALDAELVAQGPGGRRSIPAREFFVDYLETALSPDELLVEVRVPKLGPEWGFRYEKLHRVAQAWAIVGVAAAVRRDNGSIAEARIGLTNMGRTPLRAEAVEQALAGMDASNDAALAAGGRPGGGGHRPAERPVRPGRLPPAPRPGPHPAGRPARGRALVVGAGMHLNHEFVVPVPVEQAWNVLLDVERIAPCLPGATVDSVEGDSFAGRVKVKVGPITVTYKGTAKFLQRDEEAAAPPSGPTAGRRAGRGPRPRPSKWCCTTRASAPG